jgi:hypothetical protein
MTFASDTDGSLPFLKNHRGVLFVPLLSEHTETAASGHKSESRAVRNSSQLRRPEMPGSSIDVGESALPMQPRVHWQGLFHFGVNGRQDIQLPMTQSRCRTAPMTENPDGESGGCFPEILPARMLDII